MINRISLLLNGVKIVDFKEINGTLEVFLEKDSPHAICPNCHTPSTSIKHYRYYKIIDKPIESIPLHTVVKKRRFFCNNSCCPTKSFTEKISGLLKNSPYTQNFRDFLGELHTDMDYPTLKRHLARKYKLNLPLSTIHYLLTEFLAEKFTFPPFAPKVSCKYIGIDEFSYAKGHCYAVALINIDKGKIVDIVAGGKTTASAMAVLNSCDSSSVQACCIDMWPPYKSACYKKLPHASVVIDRFHIIKHINEALEKVRKRISLSIEKLDESFLYQNRFVLLRGNERLSECQRAKLSSLLSIDKDLTKAYELKEQFRTLYSIRDPELAHPQLWNWIRIAQHSQIPEFEQIGNSFASEWVTEIFNYWHHRISNGVTEGKINKIRTIQRKAYHYRNFNSLRYQILKSEL